MAESFKGLRLFKFSGLISTVLMSNFNDGFLVLNIQ